MSKLTVESIIRIYGSSVKEIKVYNEARRAKVEDFLQIEPVAFALSDEPDVLRIYIDKKSSIASLDGTLEEAAGQENTSKERKRMKQYTVYYIIKANRREWLHKMEVEAANSREATKVCKERVYAKTKKNAFRPSTSINSHFWNPTPELVAEALKGIEKDGYYRM